MVKQTAVTGVAKGGLGTAANLEDTQLWDLEDLRLPEEEPLLEAEIAATPTRERPVVQRAQPLPAPVVRAPRGQRRTGVLAAAVVGVIALAGLLALRDGLPGGASRGSGDAAGAFPSLPAAASIAPQVTAAPEGGGGSGKGKGNGKGNGNH